MQAQKRPRWIFQIHAPKLLPVWLRDFLLDVRAANRTEATIDFYKGKLQRFLRCLRAQGVSEPYRITPSILRGFHLAR